MAGSLNRASLAERVAQASARLGLVAPPFPLAFFDAYLGPIAARAVMAGASLGVFAALDDRPDDAAGVAARTGLDAERLEVLLAALATLGYVRRRRGRWRLSRTARRWVGREGRHRAWIGRFAYRSWEGIEGLEDVLRGGPPAGLHERPADDPWWADYQAAMAENAELFSAPLVKALALDAPRRALDLAGGPGVFAAALCDRHPGLEATVVELPGAARHARSHPRVRYAEGDLFAAELGEGYDVVTANSLLHNLTPERCVEVCRRARAALRPGGTFAAVEIEWPLASVATLGSLVFLTHAGTRAHTAGELLGFARAAGFDDVALRRPPALPGTVILVATAGAARAAGSGP